jgi:hypothetical protein
MLNEERGRQEVVGEPDIKRDTDGQYSLQSCSFTLSTAKNLAFARPEILHPVPKKPHFREGLKPLAILQKEVG